MDDITRQAIDLAEREAGLKLDERDRTVVEAVASLVICAFLNGTLPVGPDRPEGNFRCMICKQSLPGARLEPQQFGPIQTWTCPACGGPVGKITDQIEGATDGR